MYGSEQTITSPETGRNTLEAAMSDRNSNQEHLDRATTRSICRAVGERLGQHMRPERSDLPPYLKTLLNELRQLEFGDTKH